MVYTVTDNMIVGISLLNFLSMTAAVAAVTNADEDTAFWRELVNDFTSIPAVPSTVPTAQPSFVEVPSPAMAVRCQNPFALCAFANCTVNDDGLTADCGCYSFSDADSISVI
jgi:hypothetical protein